MAALILWLVVTYKYFGAVKRSALNDVQALTIITLGDNNVALLLIDLVHGTKDDLKLTGVQVVKHKCLIKS